MNIVEKYNLYKTLIMRKPKSVYKYIHNNFVMLYYYIDDYYIEVFYNKTEPVSYEAYIDKNNQYITCLGLLLSRKLYNYAKQHL